jgi:hypothetical protein
MKYDDVIRHKYVYENLLSNYQDANAKPKNNIPILLPRRKNLNYIADITGSDQININLNTGPEKLNYYNTSVDPLYSMKPIGHDVYKTDIQK